MRFYNRKNEIKELQTIFRQTSEQAKMIVLTGRRRIGKTLLSLEFAKKHRNIYFFVSKKDEHLLCEEFLIEIKKEFNVPVIGDITKFKDIIALLLELSQKQAFTLIIDEFQEFYSINPAVYSEIQHLWDLNKSKSQLNLILIGSVYSLINHIFQNAKEPLFGRADRIIYLNPFSIPTIHEILSDYKNQDIKTLFDFYVFTGGCPKYMDMLISNQAINFTRILDFILNEHSPFISEGKNLLIEEFGRDYAAYFTILELISAGKTSRPEIESLLEITIGGYLERLEKDYFIISKHKPINAKPGARIQKYKINDNFIKFWFRFINKNHSAIEIGNFAYVKNIIKRDYQTYCGPLLEKYFTELIANTNKYNKIGSYWEKGNQNEIDIVAINDLKKEILIAEVKLNKKNININGLKNKSQQLLKSYPGYKVNWQGLSLEDTRLFI